ncbi:MAG: ABC transporter substrate-binding protein [Geminicoccaceae bacterium]
MGRSNYSGFAVLAAVLASAVSATSALGHTDLTVVNWGGAAARAHMLALVRPYEEQENIHIDMQHYTGDLDEIRNQVEAANVKWDVVDFEYSDLIQLCKEGYLEEIDHAQLPPGADGTVAAEDFIEGALPDCAVGSIVWATVFAFSKEAFPDNPPSTIADFFDVRTYPGPRGLRRDPRGALEWALMADGVAPADVYSALATDAGVERAFEKLDEIKSDLVWWSGGPEPARMLNQGDVVMSAAWNGRLYRPMFEWDQPIDIVWDGQIWEIELWGIVKGTRHLETAREFLTFATDTERLAGQASYISYGPVRHSANALVPDDMRPHLPTTEENMTNALRYDSAWWADHLEELKQRFETWLAPTDEVTEKARF